MLYQNVNKFTNRKFYKELIENKIYEPWLNEDLFKEYKINGKIIRHTMVQFLEHSIIYDGDCVEFGVYRGGSAKIIAEKIKNTTKNLYLLDSFCGIPKINQYDNFWKVGDFADCDLVKVKNFLSNYQNVFFIDGVFANTIQKIKDKKFCFCHIDVDVYDSVLFVLDFIYDKVNSGGVILFDDYGDFVSAGAKKAVDEFFYDKPEKIMYFSTKQAAVIKK